MIIKAEEIEAEVIKKDIKRMNMRVYPDGKVKITVPKRAAKSEIETFFHERLDWIKRTRKSFFEKSERSLLFDADNDQTVFLFGKEFEIETDYSLSPGVFKSGRKITVGATGLSKAQKEKMLDSFFKDELEKVLFVFVPEWEEKTGFKASSWKIKKVKSYWGKCKVKTREILFNQNLVHYPPKCIEYVVLHELSHIGYPNHQSEFKNFLSKHMPDWKRRSDILKQTGSIS